MADLISRQAAIGALYDVMFDDDLKPTIVTAKQADTIMDAVRKLPSAQPTLYGYNIEHLDLIARVLQKENLTPERVAEALMDIGRIVAIVRDEFEESLRKAVEQCTI